MRGTHPREYGIVVNAGVFTTPAPVRLQQAAQRARAAAS